MVGEGEAAGGLRAVAEVLAVSPSEDAAPTEVVEATTDWSTDGLREATSDELVWGRLAPVGLSLVSAVAFAMRRELALASLPRRADGRKVRRVHRLRPARHAGRVRGYARAILLQGAVVELTRRPEAQRGYEAVIEEAGVRQAAGLRASRDGSVRIAGASDGQPILLRISSSAAGDAARRGGDALLLLEERSIPDVPRLIRSGRTHDLDWTVETLLPGSLPDAFSDRLWTETVGLLVRLANPAGSPITAVARHVRLLAALLPERRQSLTDVGNRLETELAALPSVIQHGDLLRDNLLAKGGRLRGIVDWDTWSEAGTPGVDLLELYATERSTGGADIGSLVLARPWEEAAFRRVADGYWAALGVAPTAPTLHTIGMAWWLSDLAALLNRPDRRHLAEQTDWVARNVDAVLKRLPVVHA